MNHIRPIAICLFSNQGRILVSEGYDPIKNEVFYRPLGGGIEFGERGNETVCRELLEELNAEVDADSLRYLGALENIFTFHGTPGHEIVLVYDGTLKEPGLYERAELRGKEANGEDIRAVWKDLDQFDEGKLILYPHGLIDLLPAPASEVK